LQAWQQRWQRLVTSGAQKVEYVCELKIDGSALALTYENGVLVEQLEVTGLQEKTLPKMCGRFARFLRLNLENPPPSVEVRGRRFTVRGVSTNQSGATEQLFANPGMRQLAHCGN